MLILISGLAFADDFETDCQGYNPGSSITICGMVDLCCDTLECWYQVDDLRFEDTDPDSVLDLICEFRDYGDSGFNITEDLPRYSRFSPWVTVPLL